MYTQPTLEKQMQNQTVILESTYYMSEERENSLINTMWDTDLMSTRIHEGCVCNTLTHEGECACQQKCSDPNDYYPIHGQEYHGMLHDIAIKAFWKSTKDTSPRADDVFNKAVDYLDRVEQVYTPGNTHPLPYRTYHATKAFRARLNLFRYELHILTYEQWAYLTNWLNILTTYVHLSGDKKGEVKQYPCNMDNSNNKDIDIEDIEYEIISMWYTQD